MNDPLEFCRRTRVLPLATEQGIRVDLILGALPYERQAIARAVVMNVGGRAVRAASREDLIAIKLFSEREKDLADARAVLKRHRRDLDRALLEWLLLDTATSMGRDDIPELLKATWKDA